MNDLEIKKETVSTATLAKRGVAAAAEIAGGVLILALHGVSARFLPLGLALGLVAGGIGISGLLSKDPDDKKPGAILTAAGILKTLCHVGPVFLRGIAGSLLSVSSVGLLAMGIVNGIRFLKGLKSRQ